MAITQALTTSFKVQLYKGQHDFSAAGGHTFKLALYTSSATLGASTTDYSTTNEVVGTGYTAGGATLTNVEPTSSGTTALLDFADVSWAGATFTARGAVLYNTTTAGGGSTTDAVAVLDFGTDKTVSAGTFTVNFPTADASSAIIRIT
jgi:hypothetical protein